MNRARLISFCGSIPLIGPSLRKIARRYPEGSVTTIKHGYLAGYRWRRSHRYVSAYWLGIYELPIQECLVRKLKPGNVFYDIGANAGFFSLLGSNCVGPEGRVFAFEPLPENIRSIRAQTGAQWSCELHILSKLRSRIAKAQFSSAIAGPPVPRIYRECERRRAEPTRFL